MRISVLHMSDIHFQNNNNKIEKSVELIASGFFNYARSCDVCVVVVTGDIAFSGKEEEYNVAYKFFSKLKENILNEINHNNFDILIVPGNHDCSLKPDNVMRNALIDSVISDVNLANNEEIVAQCTAAQSEFFLFKELITESDPVVDNRLWTEYEFSSSKRTIRFSCINAAWMSRIPEVPGQLVFPIEKFKSVIEKPVDLRLVLIHHPMNWYAQKTYHPLRSTLRTYSNAILSGHEHSPGSGLITDSVQGDTLYFEAPALQPHEKDILPGYSCLMFDLNESLVSEKRYVIVDGRLRQERDEITLELKAARTGYEEKTKLTKEMGAMLSDAGGNFTHPDKGELSSYDVFVYPELEDKKSGKKNIVSADNIGIFSESGKKILIFGDDKSGKTFLLRRYYYDFHSLNMFPLYISGSDLKKINNENFDQFIDDLASNQYVNPEYLKTAKKSSRIALFDDLDKSYLHGKRKYKFIRYLEQQFGSIIITGPSSFEISEYLDKEFKQGLDEYITYEIKSFGHLLRHKLIKKWCLCGDIETNHDLDKKTHEIETLIDNVLGKNLVPSRPLYLLILLQSSHSKSQDELQTSGLSYYYQYLVTKSLKESGVNPNKFGEIFNYVSQLAWYCHNSESQEVSISELRGFNDLFSRKYTTVNIESRLQLLKKSKILFQNGEYYYFLYPYVYYFFLGKYLASYLHKTEIRDLVSNYCENLNIKNNSSTVLFLSHHSNDPWLIEKIAEISTNCFIESKPMNMEEDVSALNTLVDSASELVIDEINVEKNQEEQRKLVDKLENEEDEQLDSDDTLDVIKKFNLMLKTNEILGLITKDYYGSIEREKKEEYLRVIFNSSLRMLKKMFDEILNDPELFVNDMEKAISEHSGEPRSEIKKYSKKMSFDIIGMISTGMIARAAKYVCSESLKEEIDSVVIENGNNAFMLIGAATRLLQPGNLPFSDLAKLAKHLKPNIFSFTVLQTLIAYYLHMFHTTDKEKQKLCKIANITMADARTISLSGQKGRLLTSSSDD